ncbi:hypothetical protein [Dyadobacter sp. 3J3]|uniref:hypothetical protein n=1 Tax=Dyadobacter sp. 3J3 TaxID=2606600 RepID=UPI001356BA16|nr:hypothetical protein [Dyadobacter sp. 3J3]
MTIQLIKGEFEANDAIHLITQMIHIKIKYHEQKINLDMNEEDIKSRERKIRKLQENLFEIKKYIDNGSGKVAIESQVEVG